MSPPAAWPQPRTHTCLSPRVPLGNVNFGEAEIHGNSEVNMEMKSRWNNCARNRNTLSLKTLVGRYCYPYLMQEETEERKLNGI